MLPHTKDSKDGLKNTFFFSVSKWLFYQIVYKH